MSALLIRCCDCGKTLEAVGGQMGAAMREAGWMMSGGATLCRDCAGPGSHAQTLTATARLDHSLASAATRTASATRTAAPGPSFPAPERASAKRNARLAGVLTGLAATALVAFVIVGHGGTGNLDPVAQAADSTLNAGGARFSLKMQMTIPGIDVPLAVSGTGYMNGSPPEGTLSMHTTSPLPGSVAAQLPGGVVQIDMVFKGLTYFMRMPGLGGQLLGGKSWIKIDVGSLLKQRGSSPLTLQAGGNPSQLLQVLRRTHAVVVGHATVRGVPTTEYRGTVDLHSLADQVPDSERDLVKSGLDQLSKQAGTSTLVIDVWIDSSHRVHRMRMTAPIGSGATSSNFDLTLSMYDFGVKQAVTAPDPSDVTDFTALAKGAFGG